MAPAGSAHPMTVHLCTLTPGQQQYETAISAWLTKKGYRRLAHASDPLAKKLQAARECDVCLLVLGPEPGPQEARSFFSRSELEATEAVKRQRLFVLIEPAAEARVVEQEPRDFLRRIKDFRQGWFANNIFALGPDTSPDVWQQRLEKQLDQIMIAQPSFLEEQEKQEETHPQLIPNAIMICSTGQMGDERAVVRDVLTCQGIPVIDYTQEGAHTLTPRDWVIASARQARAIFLLIGSDYGSEIFEEGLGATELEFEHAMDARVPVYAFLRSDAPLQPEQGHPNQASFVQRVRCLLPAEQVVIFDKVEVDLVDERQRKQECRMQLKEQLKKPILAALQLLAEQPLPPRLLAVADELRLTWYRQRLQRWMGILPHLTRKQGVPLEQVYVTLQTLPQQPIRQEKQGEHELVWEEERSQREEEEKRKQASTLTVEAALEQFPRLILQGNPGSGKSVALHWYALMAGEDVTPVFIPLIRYASALAQGEADSLEAFLVRQERRMLLTEPERPSLWLERLRQGRLLFLLDALDEVPLSQREQVVADIRTFAQTLFTSQARESCLVLTTRSAGFQREQWEDVFTITEVQTLTPAQQRQLIRYWYRVSSPEQPDVLGERTHRIVDVLERQASLNSWARTPLMLTLLTTLAAVTEVDFSERVLTKAEVYRLSFRLLLSQWSTLSDRFRSWALHQKEEVLLALAWENMREQRREVVTPEDVTRVMALLPPEMYQEETGDAERELDELSRGYGVLTSIGKQLYTFYHPTFQEYLVAVHLASLPEGARRAVLERHRLNEQWEEIAQLLVSELDRQGQASIADAVIETLIAADGQPVHPYPWCDPLHLALARAARCQGVRLRERALGPTGSKLAQRWGEILEGTISEFRLHQYEREQACQALLDMGSVAEYAYSSLQKMLHKWKEDLENLPSIYQRVFFPHLPATAVEVLGNINNEGAAQYLRDRLKVEEGIGEAQAAALKALFRLRPNASSPARDLLLRFIGAQEAMGAEPTHKTGELAAALLLQLSPTLEELERIAKLGPSWAQEALWTARSLDAPVAMPFLREMINKDKSMTWYVSEPARSRLDYHGDPDSDVRTEALEVAHHLGFAAEALLDIILYRSIYDVEHNQRLAEEVFLSFGVRAIPFLKNRFFTSYNEYAREVFFQHVLDRLETAENEQEIRRLLQEGIRQNRALEQLIDERDAPQRQKKLEEKLQEEQTRREKLHYFLQNPPALAKKSHFFQTVNDVKDYGIGAVDFLDELCALAENESLDLDTRSAALIQIANLGPRAGDKCEVVCRLVDHPLYYGEAFKALVAMKFAAAPTLPRMRQLLHHEKWVMRAHAVEVIGVMGPSAVEALPDLLAIMQDYQNLTKGQGMVRRTAVEAFGKLWPLTKPYLADLCNTLLHDTHMMTRGAAAKVLEQLKVYEPRVIEALYTASCRPSISQDSGIQGTATRALRSVLAGYDIPDSTSTTTTNDEKRKQRFGDSLLLRISQFFQGGKHGYH